MKRITKNKLTSHMYDSQKRHSKTRNHPMPKYSKDDFKSWLYAQKEFHHLFSLWELSNYDSILKPSIDRLDDDMPYTFSNIQLTTWGINRAKGHSHRKQGIGKQGRLCKPVIQYTKKGEAVQEFHSIQEAERVTGVNNSHIVECCKNKRKSAGGFKWGYK